MASISKPAERSIEAVNKLKRQPITLSEEDPFTESVCMDDRKEECVLVCTVTDRRSCIVKGT